MVDKSGDVARGARQGGGGARRRWVGWVAEMDRIGGGDVAGTVAGEWGGAFQSQLRWVLWVASSWACMVTTQTSKVAGWILAELQQLIRGASCVNFLLKSMNSSRVTIHIVEICNS